MLLDRAVGYYFCVIMSMTFHQQSSLIPNNYHLGNGEALTVGEDSGKYPLHHTRCCILSEHALETCRY